MTVYILRSHCSVYVYTELYETDEFWLVPREHASDMEVFSKIQFKLEIVKARKSHEQK